MTEASSGRARGRWRAATLAAWLGIPSLAMATEPTSRAAIESRFAEGKQRFADQQYVEAAEIFVEILGQLDEILLNRPMRENVMRNILIAYEWAYRSSTDDDGRKDVALLDEGQRVLDAYEAELARVYPTRPTPNPELVDAIARYEDAVRIAHETHGPAEPEPPVEPCLSPIPPPPTTKAKGCGGKDDPSVAWLGVLALPFVRRRRAVERLADRLPPDVVRRLRARVDEDD